MIDNAARLVKTIFVKASFYSIPKSNIWVIVTKNKAITTAPQIQPQRQTKRPILE